MNPLTRRGLASRRGESWAVALALLLWLGWSAGLRPLTLPDEGRYVGIAWEMLHGAGGLLPTLDGLPYFHKPPLFYWITAGSFAAFGPSEFAARAAPLAGAMLAALSLWCFLRRWGSAAQARWSVVVLATQPLFLVAAQFANLDMLVAGLITCSVLGFADAALQAMAGRRARAMLLGAYFASALAVLAKGLIGAVLPALVVVAWLLLARRARVMLALLWPPALLAFVLVAAPWFWLMQRRFDGFFDYFFVYQHVQRFAQGGFNNELGPWFYPAVLGVLALPWSLALLLRGPKPEVASAAAPPPEPATPGTAAAASPAASAPLVRRLMWAWLVVVVVFFSLPRSKLVGYVLPACAPLAFIVADRLLAVAARRRRWDAVLRAGAVVAAGLSAAAVLWLAQRDIGSSRALAAAFVAQRQPGEALVFVEHYPFDFRFHAGWAAPVPVVDDWGDPALAAQDNWRKELADAARFDNTAAQAALWSHERFRRELCGPPASWVVGAHQLPARHADLALAAPVASTARLALWRIERPARCAGERPPAGAPNVALRSDNRAVNRLETPSPGSAGR